MNEPVVTKFSNGSNLFTLSYRTHKKTTDPALVGEIGEVWATIRPEVERLRLGSAMIQAVEVAESAVHLPGLNFEKRQARGFLFTRGADGQWAGPTT